MIALGRLMALMGIDSSDGELAKVLPLKYREENLGAVHFGYYLKEGDMKLGPSSRRRREFDFSSARPGTIDPDDEG